MWNLRSISLLLLPLATQTAFAEPNCAPAWEHRTKQIEGEFIAGSPLSISLSDGLTVHFDRKKGGIKPAVKNITGEIIPIRRVHRGIVPVRGENPMTTHFVFGPDVLDPAMNSELSSPGEPATIATVEPTPGYRGQIWVTSTGDSRGQTNTQPKTGLRACVNWTYFPREVDTSNYSTPEALVNFPIWAVKAFDDCGLPKTALLSGRMPRPGYRNRAFLEPDLDGDGLYDLVALVDDVETGRSGLAICFQSNRRLELIGVGNASEKDPLSSDFLEQLEWWSVDGRSITLGAPGTGSKRLYRAPDGAIISDAIDN